MVREYATHAAIGGTFLVLTGFAPEEWLAHAVHGTHLPESALHLRTADIDVRVLAVIVGVAIIVGDLVRLAPVSTSRSRDAEPVRTTIC